MCRSAACTAILLIVLICASFATPSALPVSAPLAAAAPAPTAAESDEPPVTAPQNSATPQAVRYTQITLGDGHYCALTHTGAVYCWGSNSHGQLGDGTRTDTATPIQVHGLSSGVVSISAGLWHTCALMNTGEVMCWGWNSYGQLGDNSTTDRWTPVPVSGLSNVTAIEAGGRHTCAVTATGSAYCWGRNNEGQLGDNTTTTRRTPVQVRNLSNVRHISAGYGHTCAVTNTGAAYCWGENTAGQLGDGTTNWRSTPGLVRGLSSGVAGIVASGNASYETVLGHTCAVMTSGAVRCWGTNTEGQLGDGSRTFRQTTPVAVQGLTSPIASVTAGPGTTCALSSVNTVFCWGGGDTQAYRLDDLGDNIVFVASSNARESMYTHTCVLTSLGSGVCWRMVLGGNRHARRMPIPEPDTRTYAITGRVVTASDLPMRGVEIKTNTGITTTTDSNGYYRIPDLRAGTYSLSASTPGYTFNGPLTVTVGPGAEATANFTGTPKPVARTPLIFIPGIMGSRLEVNDDGTWHELWPGAVPYPGRDRIRNTYMTQLHTDRIIATDVVRRVLLIQNVYRPLIEEFLEQQQGYREDRSAPQRRTPLQRCQDLRATNRTDVTLFVFAYDWRQPIERNADELGRLIACVRTLHDAPQVNLLAHSMGGLVAGVYAQNLGDSVYVDKLITIATPWHGAPKLMMALFTGEEPLDLASRRVVGVSKDDVMNWSRAFPSAHQLLPSRTYVISHEVFGEDGWDINNNNKYETSYDYDALISMLDNRYSPAGTNATNFSSVYTHPWRPERSEVEYYTIYGIVGLRNTISKVIAESQVACRLRQAALPPSLRTECNDHNFHALRFAFGDDTVPIDSAREPGWIRTYGITPRWLDRHSFESVKHSNLPNNEDVWETIKQALNGQLAAMPSPASLQAAPLPAVYITGIGFPALSVTDSLGNLVGSDGTLAVTDTVAADYYPLGADAHALVFPAGDTYTVTLRTGDGPFNLELTRGTGDSADLAVRYVDLSLPAHISATLRITPQGVEPLRADIDGDGTFETVIPPTVDVTGAAASDLDAPVVTISATGPLDAKTVTITATDGGSGVKQLLYSLDGTTFQPYTAPFVVDATQTPVVYAFADDNVANRSSLVTWRLAWPIYLPLTAR